jgi:hypothetical protein
MLRSFNRCSSWLFVLVLSEAVLSEAVLSEAVLSEKVLVLEVTAPSTTKAKTSQLQNPFRGSVYQAAIRPSKSSRSIRQNRLNT